MRRGIRRTLIAGLFALGGADVNQAVAMDISWNGFGSAYFGQAYNSGLLPYGFGDKHANFTTFSLMGLNIEGKINDDLVFAGQLVALGNPIGSTDVFGLLAQWAYVIYTPWEGTAIKGGRQLFPALIASEYVRVGYLLPFRQIPAPLAESIPVTRFDGISASQAFETKAGKVTVGVFGGTPLVDSNSASLADAGLQPPVAKDLLGAQVTLDGEGWRVRAQANRIYAANVVGSNTLSGHLQGYSVGFRYDRHHVVSWGEYAYVVDPDGTAIAGGRYVGFARGYYWLGGYRVGRFLPRYTFAQGANNYNLPFFSNGMLTTHTIGVNYQAGQVVIKLEYEFDLVPRPGGGNFFLTVPQTSGATTTFGSALYAGVDFIF